VRLSSRICAILGGTPPQSLTYELFLDGDGQKISKSKGNGIAVEDWLKYAPPESLALFMYGQPQRAKRLYFDSIPRAVDDFLAHAGKLRAQAGPEALANPAWHIGGAAAAESPLSFTMLLNLASVTNAENPDILWGFIRRYAPAATPETMPFLDRLVHYAVAYYRDFVRATKKYRLPDERERAALGDLRAELARLPADADADTTQALVFEIGKRHGFAELRAWFGCLYQVLLGQSEGPRFGGFVALYGLRETEALIDGALARIGHAA
jgi:lysyl-tRNA synthetase class 1